MSARLRDVWVEADPLNPWRYDFPDREMAWWEMPTHRAFMEVRKVTTRAVVLWYLIVTPKNNASVAPWDAGGWRRVKCALAMLLPLPIRWRYPYLREQADPVLAYWGTGITSTPNGYSWSARYVGVGYGWSWRVWVWEEGE